MYEKLPVAAGMMLNPGRRVVLSMLPVVITSMIGFRLVLFCPGMGDEEITLNGIDLNVDVYWPPNARFAASRAAAGTVIV